MKAAVVTEVGKLEIWDGIAMPKLGPYDALCRICYGATCGGTDIHLMDGAHPFPVGFPTVLGHESVGRVVEVGEKVRNFHLDDLISRVGYPGNLQSNLGSNWGGFAEYGIARDHWQMRKDGLERLDWDRSRVHQIISKEIDERTAPMMITWRETLSYIRRLGVGSDTKLLLVGSGANALSFAAHACNLGAQVTVVGSIKKQETFEKLPIAHFINYKTEQLNQAVRDLTAGQSFDCLVDGVGDSATVNQLLSLLHKDAVVGVYGWNDRRSYGINPFLAHHSLRVYSDGYDEEEAHGEVQSMILQGKLNAELWYDIYNPVPLVDIVSAYDNLRQHKAFKYLIAL